MLLSEDTSKNAVTYMNLWLTTLSSNSTHFCLYLLNKTSLGSEILQGNKKIASFLYQNLYFNRQIKKTIANSICNICKSMGTFDLNNYSRSAGTLDVFNILIMLFHKDFFYK